MTIVRNATLVLLTVLLSCAVPPPRSSVPPDAMAVAPRPAVPAPASVSSARPQSGGPIALTTADGKELKLLRVNAQSVVAGPLAFTQLELSFENPESRTIEGRFQIALPRGASVSRFAMKIHGRWQEGEMLEKARARSIYEDFLHRRVDPALLEQGVGNAFGARVFPIPANGVKELVISYAQPIEAVGDTLVPLEGLPEIANLDVEVTRDGSAPAHVAIHETGFVPRGDFVIDEAFVSADGLRSGELAVTRVEVADTGGADPMAATLFLIDTSASRALELEQQLTVLGALLAKLGDHAVVVAGFDQRVEVFYRGAASAFTKEHRNVAASRRAMGASDLGSALAWAQKAAPKDGFDRIVILGDGVVTAGVDGKPLLRRVKRLTAAGVKRVDAIAFGGIRDHEGLKALVTAGLADDGVVIDSQRGADEAWRRLNLATLSDVKIHVAGARWWWPRKLDGVQAGDDVLVHAELDAARPVRIRLGGDVQELQFVKADRMLVERSWARAKIASLVDRERRKGGSSSLKKKIVGLSTAHRVMSPYTSLLVLETEADYERYELDRASLANIVEIDHGQLAVVARNPVAAGTVAERPPASAGNVWEGSINDSLAASGTGTATGRPQALAPPATEGHGAGIGRATPRTHRARPPRIRMGSTHVSGRMPPEVIRRIVRVNHGRMRGCYQAELLKNPTLKGRATARFIIARDGTVANAKVSTTLAGKRFTQCLETAFAGLTFPQPEGGIITVVYPIVFEPHGSTQASKSSASVPRVRKSGVADVVPRGSPRSVAKRRPAKAEPHDGRFRSVMFEVARGRKKLALTAARDWHRVEPGNVLALVALGEAYELSERPLAAARAYGSIIDLFPSRADLRRYAGERLDRVETAVAKQLAVDNYRKAKVQRGDHPTSHRLLGYALLRTGKHREAFDAVVDGLRACTGRYQRARHVLERDLGLIGAAWLQARPAEDSSIRARLRSRGITPATAPSISIVLNWETDANDVDLHVHDTNGDHAYFGKRWLPSGGRLHDDITAGYGPELFTIQGATRADGYKFQVHYYARGPMGYGMGKLHIIEHDGKGTLKMSHRPFVVMKDGAYADLGTLGKWKEPAGL